MTGRSIALFVAAALAEIGGAYLVWIGLRDDKGALLVVLELSHRAGDCTFETLLARYELDDPALRDMARIVHEADFDDERFDAPEARGLDVILRGLSMVVESDEEMLDLSGPLYDGLYEYRRRATMLGREPG